MAEVPLDVMKDRIYVSVQEQDFDLSTENRAIEAQVKSSGIGAVAAFIGRVREGQNKVVDSGAGQSAASTEHILAALDIEHYPAMTTNVIHSICQQAADKWPLAACRVIHRVGRLAVGEQIVLVLTAAAHRKEAFAACEFIMDFLKTEAPFWKKAIFEDTEQWVPARQADRDALKRWAE